MVTFLAIMGKIRLSFANMSSIETSYKLNSSKLSSPSSSSSFLTSLASFSEFESSSGLGLPIGGRGVYRLMIQRTTIKLKFLDIQYIYVIYIPAVFKLNFIVEPYHQVEKIDC